MEWLRVVAGTTLCLLLLSSCTEEKAAGPSDELVEIKVDLQWGFAGLGVRLRFNGDWYFRADFPEEEPFAGPMASFRTFLPRGANRLEATWSLAGQMTPVHQDSTDFYLGDADEYYLGVWVYEDTLWVEVRDSPYLYVDLIWPTIDGRMRPCERDGPWSGRLAGGFRPVAVRWRFESWDIWQGRAVHVI